MTHQLYNTYSIIKLAAKIKIHHMTDVVLSAAFDKKKKGKHFTYVHIRIEVLVKFKYVQYISMVGYEWMSTLFLV